MNLPSDAASERFPVSIKGVILREESVVLLKNERDEWELPGGKLELGEDIKACLEREIAEELSVSARVGALLDAWVYTIASVEVVILTYDCRVDENAQIQVSHEHKEVGLFRVSELDEIPLPYGYKRGIREAYLKTQSDVAPQPSSVRKSLEPRDQP